MPPRLFGLLRGRGRRSSGVSSGAYRAAYRATDFRRIKAARKARLYRRRKLNAKRTLWRNRKLKYRAYRRVVRKYARRR